MFCVEMYQDRQLYSPHPPQGWAAELVGEVDGGKACLAPPASVSPSVCAPGLQAFLCGALES